MKHRPRTTFDEAFDRASPRIEQRAGLFKLLLSFALILCAAVASADEDVGELERLMLQTVDAPQKPDITVTSAGRRNQKLSETPAAIYVITADDLRRSGVTNIPDALRMVPGLNVARIDSNKWAVSSRGFNDRYANKLLVLMDGREVYNPTFGGVYWEFQDLPMQDIKRIEVIRGPGASLWGANAVNGVVNIISKSAQETVGGQLSGGGGSYEKYFGSFRYGYRFNDNTAARVWAKGFQRGSFVDLKGRSEQDDWSQTRAGFRIDNDDHDGSEVTVIGNAYDSPVNQAIETPISRPPYSLTTPDRTAYSGYNLLGRWKQALSVTSEMSLQAYYDHFYRKDVLPPNYGLNGYGEERDTFDLEFQHRFQWNDVHKFVWGLGYRLLKDHFGNASDVVFNSRRVNKQLFSAFLQDDFTLIDNTLVLTLGAKVQHNDYTGFEGQPNIRLLWTPSANHTVWAAISRGVRTPSRIETDASLGVFTVPPNSPGNPFPVSVRVNTAGNPTFASEEVLASELGYRYRFSDDLYTDIALFYNDFTSLRSFDARRYSIQGQAPNFKVYLPYRNQLDATAYGAEWLVNWRPTKGWALEFAYSYMNMKFHGPFGVFSAEMGNSPQQQFSMRSNLNVTRDVDFDLWLRYVDGLPFLSQNPDELALDVPKIPRWLDPIPAYVTLDARLAWRPIKNLEFSVVGQNLLDSQHPEYQQELLPPPRAQVPRSFYFMFDWKF